MRKASVASPVWGEKWGTGKEGKEVGGEEEEERGERKEKKLKPHLYMASQTSREAHLAAGRGGRRRWGAEICTGFTLSALTQACPKPTGLRKVGRPHTLP